MTTLQTRSEAPTWRSLSTVTLFAAVAAVAILVLAAAWPGGGDALLSAATADTAAAPAPAARDLPQGTGVPDAAEVFAGKPEEPEEQFPTF